MAIIEFISYLLFFYSYIKLFLMMYSKFKKGYFSVAMPLAFTLIIFLFIPIILDMLFGKPDFSKYKGFDQASMNTNSDILYNFYASFVALLIRRYIKKNKTQIGVLNSTLFYGQVYKVRYILWFLMLLPLLAVLFSNDPSQYLTYKVLLYNRTEEFRQTHVFVGKATLIALASAALLVFFLSKKGNSSLVLPKYLLYTALLFFSFWVDGKRGIIAKYLFLLLISGWILGKIKPSKIVKRGVLSLIVLTFFVASYGKDFASSSNFDRTIYSSFRLNLGRDHTIKYTLYKEFEVVKPVLEYRGQSFLFDLLFFIPRSMWSGKPYPYAVYFVTDVLNLEREPIGWSFTTCILEEFISNFGFTGMLLAPLFLLWICRIGDNTSNIILTFFSILVAVFFMFTQLAAFMPLFIVFIYMVIIDKRKRIKAKNRFV